MIIMYERVILDKKNLYQFDNIISDHIKSVQQ